MVKAKALLRQDGHGEEIDLCNLSALHKMQQSPT